MLRNNSNGTQSTNFCYWWNKNCWHTFAIKSPAFTLAAETILIRTCVSISHSDRVAGNVFSGSGGIWLLPVCPLMSGTSTCSEERSTSESIGLTPLDTQLRMYWKKTRNKHITVILTLTLRAPHNYRHLLYNEENLTPWQKLQRNTWKEIPLLQNCRDFVWSQIKLIFAMPCG